MKNIYVLQTHKPSRLILYSKLLNEFKLLDNPIEDWIRKLNIYITSDEEIDDDDWYLDISMRTSIQGVHKCNSERLKLLLKDHKDSYKKIILTTDLDLINAGVQAIDDEFLKWFVKNPNCDEVKVELHIGSLRWSDSKNSYKIIIQKEKPNKLHEMPLAVNSIIISCASKHKHETIEEAAENYANQKGDIPTTELEDAIFKRGFLDGAKWQAERSFTLEQIDELFFNEKGGYFDDFLDYRLGLTNNQGKNKITFKEWFEQFKTK